MRRLSIIIPAYNAQDYIEESLDTLLELLLKKKNEYEVILVDDGSTDGTPQICDAYEVKYDMVQVLHKKNEGVSVARNAGLKMAHGTYVMFLDADDYLDRRNWGQVETLVAGEAYDFVAYSYTTLYGDGSTGEELFRLDANGDRCSDMRRIRTLAYASSKLNTCWAKLFRRSLIEQEKITFPAGMKIGEDAMFVMEFVENCATGLLVDVPILYYRQNEISAMHQSDSFQKLEEFRILYEYRNQVIGKESEIYPEMCREHFSVITNLMLQSALQYPNWKERREQMKRYQESKLVCEIVENVDRGRLHPIYKKLEFNLMRKNRIMLLTWYFGWKAFRVRR